MTGFTEPTHNLDGHCICGHTGRKHRPRGHQYPFSCSLCSCMYFEIAPIEDSRPLEEHVADAVRCTTHIEDRVLRARYILQDLRLRGFVVQRVTRDDRGRFIRGAA